GWGGWGRRAGGPVGGDDRPAMDVAIVNASCGGGGRPRARQRDDGLEPGVVILELELAAMQAGHRRSKAEPQTGARERAALFEPHEALDRAAAVGRGNAATAIRDRQHDAVALSRGRDEDLSRGPRHRRPTPRPTL